MNNEITQDLPDKRSFEERVFARFDSMDARFNSVDARFDAVDARFNSVDARFDLVEGRLQVLEEQSERRAMETKPIWERALKEIMDTRQELGETRRNLVETRRYVLRSLHRIEAAVSDLRSDLNRAEERIDKLEELRPER